MRILLIALSLLLSATVLLAPGEARAVDCGEARGACVANCGKIIGNPARLQACVNRCSIGVCPVLPQACRPGDQTVCNTGFSSCQGACDALAAIPSAAATVNATACASRCCSNFKACLSQRSCDVSGLVCRRF